MESSRIQSDREVTVMKRVRFIFSEALVIWAYACLLSGYQAAAAGIAVWAAASTAVSFTKEKQMRVLPYVSLLSLAGLLLIHICDLRTYLPTMGIIMMTGIYCSVIHPYCHPEETEGAMRIIMGAGLVFVILALLVPAALFAVKEMLILLLIIFGPCTGMYLRGLLIENNIIKPVAADASLR